MITQEAADGRTAPEGTVVVTRDPSWMPAPEAGAFEVRSPEEGLEMMEKRALANSRLTEPGLVTKRLNPSAGSAPARCGI